MPSSQRHCPYCGRWLGRPAEYCDREYCQQRHEDTVSALEKALEAMTAVAVVYTLVTNPDGTRALLDRLGNLVRNLDFTEVA